MVSPVLPSLGHVMSLGNLFIPPSFSGSPLHPQHATLHAEFQKTFDKHINESCKCKGTTSTDSKLKAQWAQTVNYCKNSFPSALGRFKLSDSSSSAPAPRTHPPPSRWAASSVCLQCIRCIGYQRVRTQEAAWGDQKLWSMSQREKGLK